MAKPGRLPDFRKMYPEASEEVIEVLKETERKMQYQEYDLKADVNCSYKSCSIRSLYSAKNACI